MLEVNAVSAARLAVSFGLLSGTDDIVLLYGLSLYDSTDQKAAIDETERDDSKPANRRLKRLANLSPPCHPKLASLSTHFLANQSNRTAHHCSLLAPCFPRQCSSSLPTDLVIQLDVPILASV